MLGFDSDIIFLTDGINKRESVEAGSTRLIRNRRNISWYKQHSDFWSWYKYFTDNGNQEGVSRLLMTLYKVSIVAYSDLLV